MKKLLKFTSCLAVLVLVMVLFTGCILTGKVTGGGWFMDGDNKCTFGFNAQGDYREGEGFIYKGQFQFNDRVGGVKIHAKVLSLLDFGETYAWFQGETNDGEDLYVFVEDMGQPGADPGDSIKIWIDTSPLDPPTYEGDLEGGNLQVH